MSVRPAKAGPAALVLLAFVRMYRRLFAGRPSPCRFTPTCSAYAEDAVRTHGAAGGSWLAARRLSRCRPGGGFGFDPVPDLAADVAGSSGLTVSTAGASIQTITQHPRRVS